MEEYKNIIYDSGGNSVILNATFFYDDDTATWKVIRVSSYIDPYRIDFKEVAKHSNTYDVKELIEYALKDNREIIFKQCTFFKGNTKDKKPLPDFIDYERCTFKSCLLQELILDNTHHLNFHLKSSHNEFRYCDIINTSAFFPNSDIDAATFIKCNLKNIVLDEGFTLKWADFNECKFTDCDFSKAQFEGYVSMEHSDLDGLKLSESEQIRKGITLTEPMIGYKKCSGGRIVKLEISAGATVFSINNYKCRTNKAKCLEITRLSAHYKVAKSIMQPSFVYTIGKEYELENFDMDYAEECSTGIHFFQNFEDAVHYHIG